MTHMKVLLMCSFGIYAGAVIRTFGAVEVAKIWAAKGSSHVVCLDRSSTLCLLEMTYHLRHTFKARV